RRGRGETRACGGAATRRDRRWRDADRSSPKSRSSIAAAPPATLDREGRHETKTRGRRGARPRRPRTDQEEDLDPKLRLPRIAGRGGLAEVTRGREVRDLRRR